MDRPYGRGLALAAWFVAATGIALILASTLSADRLNIPLQVVGFALFVLGSVGFVVRQLRSF